MIVQIMKFFENQKICIHKKLSQFATSQLWNIFYFKTYFDDLSDYVRKLCNYSKNDKKIKNGIQTVYLLDALFNYKKYTNFETNINAKAQIIRDIFLQRKLIYELKKYNTIFMSNNYVNNYTNGLSNTKKISEFKDEDCCMPKLILITDKKIYCIQIFNLILDGWIASENLDWHTLEQLLNENMSSIDDKIFFDFLVNHHDLNSIDPTIIKKISIKNNILNIDILNIILNEEIHLFNERIEKFEFMDKEFNVVNHIDKTMNLILKNQDNHYYLKSEKDILSIF